MKLFLLLVVAATAIMPVTVMASQPPIGPDYLADPPVSERENLNELRKYYEEGSYAWTVAAAEFYIENYPKGTARPEVHYKLAMSQLYGQEHEGVLDNLEYVMKKHPNSEYAIDAADVYVDLFSEMNNAYYYWDWNQFLMAELGVEDTYGYNKKDFRKIIKAREKALKLAEKTYKNHIKGLSGGAKDIAADRNIYNHIIMMPYLGFEGPPYENFEASKQFDNFNKYVDTLQKKDMSNDMHSALEFYRGILYANLYPIDEELWDGSGEEDYYFWLSKQRFSKAETHWNSIAKQYPDVLGGLVAKLAIAHYEVYLYNNPEKAAIEFEELTSLIENGDYREYLEMVVEELRGPAMAITAVTSDPRTTPNVEIFMGAKVYDSLEMTLYPVEPREYYAVSGKLHAVDIYFKDGRKMQTDSDLWYDYGDGEKINYEDIDRIEPRPTANLPGVGKAVKSWSVESGYKDDLRIAAFSTTIDDLEPGLYVVEAVADDGNMSRSLFLHSKTTIVTTEDGYGFYYQLSDSENGAPVAIDSTNAFNIVYEPDERGYNRNVYKDVDLNLKRSGDGYFIEYDEIEKSSQVFLIIESDEGPALTSFYTPYSEPVDSYETGVVYTDKPMYEPEETVNYKVILRNVDYIEKVLAPIANEEIALRLLSPDYSEIWTGEGTTDEYGTLWGNIELPAGTMLGTCYLYAEWSEPLEGDLESKDGENLRNFSVTGSFSLEEYEKPEYEMFIQADKDRYLSGEEIKLIVTGKYFFGGPMADSKVEYEVTRSGYIGDDYEYSKVVTNGEDKTDSEGQFELKWDSKYAGEFDNSYNVYVKLTDPSNHEIEEYSYVYTYRSDRFISVSTDKYDYYADDPIEVSVNTYDWYNDYVSMPVDIQVYETYYNPETYVYDKGELLYEDTVTTDEDGDAKLIVELPSAPPEVLIEAKIEDTMGTETITSVQVKIVPAGEETTERVPEIEITTDEYYPDLGDTINIKIRSRFEDVSVGLLYYSGDFEGYENVELSVDPEGGYSTTIPIECEDRFLPQLQLKANLFHEQTYYQSDVTAYITNTNTKMDVAVDIEKEEYTPSDNAAKVTVTTKDQYELPIIANLSLAAVDRSLLELRYDQTQYLPGQFPGFINKYGWPYVNNSLYDLGEMSTTVYKFLYYSGISYYYLTDEDSKANDVINRFGLPYAVDPDIALFLGYSGYNSLDPSIYDRSTGWSMGLNSSSGGGGMGGLGLLAGGAAGAGSGDMLMEEMSVNSPSMTKSKRMSADEDGFGFYDVKDGEKAPAPTEGEKEYRTEADKSEMPEDTVTIAGKSYAQADLRKTFTDLAFWKPDLYTNKNGAVSVDIELPDNLTTWRVMALAVDKGQRIGWGYGDFTVTKNVIVRIKAPRCMVVGDTAEFKTLAHNYLSEKKDIAFSIECAELELVKGDLQKNKMVDADGKDYNSVWYKAAEAGKAYIKAGAYTDVESDALVKDIPIFPHGIVQRQAFAGRLRDNISHDLTLADSIDPETFTGEIIMSPSLAKSLSHGLDYFDQYPYDCVEQTLNRFLINALLAESASDLGLDESKLSEGLSDAIDIGVARMEETQTSDGGWPWWKGGTPSPYMSAYALDGLYTIRDNPFLSDIAKGKVDNMILSGTEYLVKYVDSLENDPERYDWELSLFIVDIALRHNIIPTDYEVVTDALDYYFESRNPMSDRGMVLLGTVSHYCGDTDKVGTVLRNLDNGAKLGTDETLYWGSEGAYCWRWWDDSVETTAKVLDLKMLVDPQSKQIPYMVDWLVDERRGSVWKSTKDSAEATKTIMRYLSKYPEATKPIIVSYLLNETSGGLELDPLAFENPEETADLPLESFRTGDNTLSITRDEGLGPVFYTVAVEYYTESENIPAVQGSVTLTREYFEIKRFKKDGKMEEERKPFDGTIEVGDELEVEITINSPYDFDYVIVEDPRPAGCIYTEAGSGYSWWLNAFTELRNEKRVVLFERLNQGETVYSYRLKAEVPGDYAALPASIKGMYSPDIGSTTANSRVKVKE